jgi:pimeloyl-ACP methyl ester carboxylesterase
MGQPTPLWRPTPLTFVLIPGAGGQAWYWHLAESLLRQRGHDVVAVDLPADDDTAGIPEYAEVVVRAIGQRTNVVVVGQSMGGFTAPLVCQQVDASLLVLLNAMIPTPGETPGAWWAATGQAQARRESDIRAGRNPDADFDIRAAFFHDVSPELTDYALANDRPQSSAPFKSSWTLQAWPTIPIRVMTARDDRFFPAELQRRIAQQRLGITPDEIPGGHLVALSHPAELVDRLEAYASGLHRPGAEA